MSTSPDAPARTAHADGDPSDPDRRVKVCVLGDEAYYRRVYPANPYLVSANCLFLGRAATNDEVVSAMPDAEVLLVDAIAPVTADLIERLPRLRLVNSEGVGYDKIDLACAAEHGVYVCNNQGMNAGAVAEQTVLLMLGLLRGVVAGDAAVRAGHQIDAKMRGMREGITDLADCTVGLVGLGCIGQATAARLKAFGARVLYTGRAPKDAALERELGVSFAPRDELLAASDFVSIHCAVTPQTAGMVDRAFLQAMRPDAYLVNTVRGEIVDNEALAWALENGIIAGAGLDTVYPEPVTCDNVLLNLSEQASARILFSPHVGGVTTGSMRRGQAHMWENVARIERGERPTCVVNGL